MLDCGRSNSLASMVKLAAEGRGTPPESFGDGAPSGGRGPGPIRLPHPRTGPLIRPHLRCRYGRRVAGSEDLRRWRCRCLGARLRAWRSRLASHFPQEATGPSGGTRRFPQRTPSLRSGLARSPEQPRVIHAVGLAFRELRVTAVERVVHVVVDRIQTRGLARVLADRTATRRCPLGGRVRDSVARWAALALERVGQIQPVADLVRSGLALVVLARVAGRRAEHRLPVDY